MRKVIRGVGAVALVCIAVLPQIAKAASETTTDRLIVKYRSTALPKAAVATGLQPEQTRRAGNAAHAFGSTLTALRQTAQGAQVFKLDRALDAASVAQMAEQLRRDDSTVEYAEPDLRMFAHWTPSDPAYGWQWDLHDPVAGIRAPGAWDRSSGQGVTVAVLDTGYTPHTDLLPNIVGGHDFIADAGRARDGGGRDASAIDEGDWRYAGECAAPMANASNSSWHGSHVAGTIAAAANNGQGIAGIAYGARILPVRVLGKCGGYTSDIADGIIWAAGGQVSGAPGNGYPARVLNLSLGGTGACGQTYQNAINTARSLGALVVVSAGNDNADVANATPANCLGVMAIAATDTQGGKASFSNHGYGITLAAPGVSIYSLYNTGTTVPAAQSYSYMQGTSMAAPHVAGVAALMFSVNPYLNDRDVERKLRASARPFPASCTNCGVGLLDANAAVATAQGNSAIAPTVEIVQPPFSGGLGVTTREAFASDGQAPYSYHWTVSNSSFRLESPTARSTKISASVPYCEFVSSNLTITVTDALGRTGSATTNIRFSNPRVPGRQCP